VPITHNNDNNNNNPDNNISDGKNPTNKNYDNNISDGKNPTNKNYDNNISDRSIFSTLINNVTCNQASLEDITKTDLQFSDNVI